MSLLAWVTKEPKGEILRKADLSPNQWVAFDSFVAHILLSSVVSRHQFLHYTLSHRLSWQVLGDFFREHVRRLEDEKRLYPVFSHEHPSDSPWNVHYAEWPNRFGNTSDSRFICTVPYYWVHDQDIIGNYQNPPLWKRIRNKWTSFSKTIRIPPDERKTLL